MASSESQYKTLGNCDLEELDLLLVLPSRMAEGEPIPPLRAFDAANMDAASLGIERFEAPI